MIFDQPSARLDEGIGFRRWPTLAAIRRWHFYAGLFAIPFVLWLALTGSIYLWRPQIDAWLDAPYDRLPIATAPASPGRIAAAAVAATGMPFRSYELPVGAGRAARVVVGTSRHDAVRVYIDPEGARILGQVRELDRPMNVVFHLHGDLLQGDPGSWLIELAGSWAVVMIVSGLCLWWPRGQGFAGTLWPRLRGPSRQRWRDLHAVTGVWVSALALFMLLSGLPWAKSWSGYLKAVRSVVEGPQGAPDWMSAGEHSTHKPGMAMATSRAPVDLGALDRLVPAAAAARLAYPAMLSPPARPGAPWLARSEAQNRTIQATILLDPVSGRVVARRDFAAKPFVDRVVNTGVAVHEGQLFGLANQLLNLAVAAGLALMSVSAVVLWWRRRPGGVLGAPPARAAPLLGTGFVAVLTVLGTLLPLFGVSSAARAIGRARRAAAHVRSGAVARLASSMIGQYI